MIINEFFMDFIGAFLSGKEEGRIHLNRLDITDPAVHNLEKLGCEYGELGARTIH